MKAPVIAIVIPCYNEQEALPITAATLLKLLDSMQSEGLIDPASYVMCSNDGSRDSTWQVITELHAADQRIKGISLAHNRGHQYALLAGLMEVKDHCDAAVSIDADLQDDPAAIREMVKAYLDGKKSSTVCAATATLILGSNATQPMHSIRSRNPWDWTPYMTTPITA